MNLNLEILAVALYVCILLTIGFFSYRKHSTASDFIIGGRSLNFWLTAFAAHASDMSSWLFMGYPSIVYDIGVFKIWVAVGLIIFMFLNWHYIAPRVRTATEQYKSLTFSSFFESRFADTSGLIRLFTGIMSLIFFSVYISAGLTGLGLLIKSLFGVNYSVAITFGILIIIPYLFIGGYVTLAWTDLFQALFLLVVIAIVPLFAFAKIGSFEAVKEGLIAGGRSTSFFPNFSPRTFLEIGLMVFSWGLGYFGQPHIITKFMGIKNVKDMYKSKYVGMTWMILTMGFASIIGIIGVQYFHGTLENSMLIFVNMVHQMFPVFIGAFILCAILAATVSTMDSQILVLASIVAEDFYKRLLKKDATSKQVLRVSRISIFFIAAVAYVIASFQMSTIFDLVSYAWYGLGSSFGPILILALFSKKVNKYGAWAGIAVGGGIATFWPLVSKNFTIYIPSLIPGFFLSILAIYLVSLMTKHKTYAAKE